VENSAAAVENCDGDPPAHPSQRQQSPQQPTLPLQEPLLPKPPAPPPPPLPQPPEPTAPDGAQGRFERFWAAWPKKVAKADAQKAFARLGCDDALLALIVDAVERQARSPGWRKEGGKYVPHPATWLRGRRWEDEPGPAGRPPPGGGFSGYDRVDIKL
jgi:hypothetical protein